MRVRYTRRAQDDLTAILAYLGERSFPGAHTVRSALKTTISLIGHFPEIGRPAGEPGVRVLPAGRYPYLVYWRVARSEVQIVHIRHAGRLQPET